MQLKTNTLFIGSITMSIYGLWFAYHQTKQTYSKQTQEDTPLE